MRFHSNDVVLPDFPHQIWDGQVRIGFLVGSNLRFVEAGKG